MRKCAVDLVFMVSLGFCLGLLPNNALSDPSHPAQESGGVSDVHVTDETGRSPKFFGPAVLSADVASALYELVPDPSQHAVFVASAASGGEGKGGRILQLDDRTLQITRQIDLPQQPFALAFDARTRTLYAGLTIDAGVTAIDVDTGTVRGTLFHGLKNAKGETIHTRQIVVDEAAGKVIVSGIAEGGFLWVIDAASFTTDRIIQTKDLPTVGLTLDAPKHRLITSGTAAYATVDTQSWEQTSLHQITPRFKPDDLRRFLINTALDTTGARLFANQSNNNEGTLVFDMASGEILKTIPTGDTTVGIRFNPVRNEVYVASLGDGTVSVIDADSYQIKHTLRMDGLPNSLALSADGQSLFVSLKQPGTGPGQPPATEKVARIDLGAL
jgi:YVTN family beta-propeller protein